MSHSLADSLVGKQLLFALVESPQLAGGGGKYRATLCPLMVLETQEVFPNSGPLAVQARRAKFPPQGHVFWWDVDSSWKSAELGTLFVGVLKKSDKYGSPDKEWFEVIPATVSRPGPDVLDEFLVVDLPADADLRTLVDEKFEIFSDYPVAPIVRVWTGEQLLGPFDVKREDRQVDGRYRIRLSTRPNLQFRVEVHQNPGLQAYLESGPTSLRCNLSLNGDHSGNNATCHYRVLLRSQRDKLAPEISDRVPLLPDEQILNKVLEQFQVSRRQRQELVPQFLKWRDDLASGPAAVGLDVEEAFRLIVSQVEQRQEFVEELARRLAAADVMQDRLDEAIQNQLVRLRAEQQRQIEQEFAEETAQVKKEIDRLHTEQQRLRAENQTLQDENAQEQARLVSERELFDQHTQNVLGQLDGQRDRLLADLSLLMTLWNRDDGLSEHNGSSRRNETSKSAAAERPARDNGDLPGDNPIEDLSGFLSKRLWPCLWDRVGPVGDQTAELFFAAVLTCQTTRVPHLGWAAALHEALGGRTELCVLSVEPDWLSFRQLWSEELADFWQRSVAHPDRLFLLALDGIDRSPSQGWITPLLHVMAKLRDRLPHPAGFPWNHNLRALIATENGTGTFPLPTNVLHHFAAVEKLNLRSESSFPEEPLPGYLPIELWNKEWDAVEQPESRFNDFEMLASNQEGIGRRQCCLELLRLRRFFARRGHPPDRIEKLVHRIRWTVPDERDLVQS